jgi:tripartite-type tricarboxylate transporter receptor subunit TctC
MVSVIGLYGRADLPAPIVAKLAAEASATMKDAGMNPPLAALGMEPVGEGPGPFAKIIAQEVDTITRVVESAGLKPK